MEGRRIFICYAKEDYRLAHQIACKLDMIGLGHRIFLDEMHIRSGQHRGQTIHRALSQASHVILLHTEESFLSRDVWDQWGFARSRNVPVIPIICDQTELPFSLIHEMTIVNRGNLDSVVEQLRNHLDAQQRHEIEFGDTVQATPINIDDDDDNDDNIITLDARRR